MNIEQFERFQGQAREANVIYYFSGDLNQAILGALGEALRHRLEAQGVAGPVRRKLFSTFVEMAQNVIHYAAPEDGPSSEQHPHKRASIALGWDGSSYWIVCGNQVQVEYIPRISERLTELRSLSLPEIKERYKHQVANDEHQNQDGISKGAGLGLLTIARDSKFPIEFSFASDPASNGSHAFFIIKAVV
ncbi:SiaB family protein kinase [Holophaga foetida]|uniref:SiaB family protein kinase n=1 Tax=Holophaga foetida TaxID=35839 RepID=UPI000247216E|nr:SiaB family protein kinase [Holophaga foetida]